MAVNLSPVGGVAGQFFDNNGVILSGGKIYTYAAGTSTNATTYTSSSGITAHTNPIILDSAGHVPSGEIWLTDGISYKFVIKKSDDTLIGTYDNISGINSNFVAYTAQQEIQTATAGQTVFTLATMQYQPGTDNLSVFVDGVNQYGPGAQYAFVETDSSTVTFTDDLHVGASVKFTTATPVASAVANAENVAYDPPFTGSVTTNVEAKLAQTVSVKDFGAAGDGATDDTAAIQAAIEASSLVFFPEGTYKVTEALTLGDNIELIGTSGTIIDYTGTGNLIENATPGTRVYSWRVHELFIQTSTGNTAFLMDSVSTSEFFNVTVVGFDRGFDLYSPTSGHSVYNRFYNCRVEGGDINYLMRGTSTNANTFYACRSGGFSSIGFYVNNSNDNTIDACQIENNTGAGVEFSASAAGLTTGNRVQNSRFEGAMTYGVNLGSYTSSNILIGNAFVTSVLTNVRDDCGGAYTRIDAYDARLNAPGYFATGSSDVVTGNRVSADGVVFAGQKAGATTFDIQTLNGGILLRSVNEEAVLGNGVNLNYYWNSTAFYPETDNARTLGNGFHRWSVVYAATGTINTSDANQKQDIAEINETEKRVAVKLKQCIKKFRFKDAFQNKGDAARIHFGVIAQEVQLAFESEGLDATQYGLFCVDKTEAGDNLLGIRYEELLAFVIAAL